MRRSITSGATCTCRSYAPCKASHAAADTPACTVSTLIFFLKLSRGLFWFVGAQMNQVLIVLQANVFQQFPSRLKRNLETGGPRLGVRARIVDGSFVTQRIEIRPPEFFDHVQLLGRGMPHIIQPGAPVEAHR